MRPLTYGCLLSQQKSEIPKSQFCKTTLDLIIIIIIIITTIIIVIINVLMFCGTASLAFFLAHS